MKRLISLACIAMLTACGGGGGGGSAFPVTASAPEAMATEPAAPVAAPVCTVELNGDSIMWGQMVIPGSTAGIQRLDWTPAMWLKHIRPAYTVVDKSVGGQTATARAATFNNETRTSRIIVIQHGVNENNQDLGVQALEVALKSMVTYAQAERRIVVLTGMSKTSLQGHEAYEATVAKFAVDTGAAYANWPSVPVKTTDAAHPDQASSQALVEQLARTLDTLAPECGGAQ